MMCRYNFKAREEEAAQLMQTNKEDVLEAFKEYLWPESKQRSRLAIHVLGKKYMSELQQAVSGVSMVRDPEDMRTSLDQHTVPRQ